MEWECTVEEYEEFRVGDIVRMASWTGRLEIVDIRASNSGANVQLRSEGNDSTLWVRLPGSELRLVEPRG